MVRAVAYTSAPIRRSRSATALPEPFEPPERDRVLAEQRARDAEEAALAVLHARRHADAHDAARELEPLALPAGMVLRFPWVNVRGERAWISGHGPQETDGSPAGPLGALGETVSGEQGYASARKAGLSMLGNQDSHAEPSMSQTR